LLFSSPVTFITVLTAGASFSPILSAARSLLAIPASTNRDAWRILAIVTPAVLPARLLKADTPAAAEAALQASTFF
jgi:hypothetical protein